MTDVPRPMFHANDDVLMTATDYHALTDAREHVIRALSAARASRPCDSVAMVALDQVRDQLIMSLRLLDELRRRARVTE